jgi:hypothetical protein
VATDVLTEIEERGHALIRSTMSARRTDRERIPLAPCLALIVLLAVWAVWYPPSPDLAAQAYRVHLFSVDGFSLWDNNWYSGHYLPSYSLIFPALAAMAGMRLVGVAAVVISCWAFWALVRDRPDFRPRLATTLFIVSATGDLFIGRLAFALGVALGMLSVLSIVRGSRASCAIFSLACAAASPVAAAFLALVALADLIASRKRLRALVLGGPALVLTLTVTLLFPEGGYEPFAFTSLLAGLAASSTVMLLAPREARLVRCVAGLYFLALLAAYLVRSPMGSNAIRFGVLFAPATLAGCVRTADVQRLISRLRHLCGRLMRLQPQPSTPAGRRAAVAVLALACATMLVWQVAGPFTQSVRAAESPASRYSFYLPAIRYLERRSHGKPMRIEVAFTSSHWDAVFLGSHFLLARGWERQVDTKYDSLFYAPRLTASAYHRWLLANAVRFVVLPAAPLDFSSLQEAALIRAGLPFLRLSFHTSGWRIYEVRGRRPIATGPGILQSLNGDGFSLDARRAGTFLVRVHYTPYWAVTSGAATVRATTAGWTEITALQPGQVAVDAQFSMGV